MNTRTGGDNGYQTAEDMANAGRGYEPANHTDLNSAIHNKVDTVIENGGQKSPTAEQTKVPVETGKNLENDFPADKD